QLTLLLFLKMADEQMKPPYSRPRLIPSSLDWSSLERLDGDDLESHYRHILTERSEEHTSELQSRFDLVCRLLLEKKNKIIQKKPPGRRRRTLAKVRRIRLEELSYLVLAGCIARLQEDSEELWRLRDTGIVTV